MHHDSRAYIELRYDGNTADVVMVVFRNRGIDGVETVSREFPMLSPELTNDVWHEIKMGLHGILDEMIDRP
uniref:Uncharacterized protein n=1 Tax=uncultured prokaryote TaxID=198431 RepID=A0A0H5Q6V8_9ZZZZ|nr:hypothetical protein [uncultured prokaryote]